MIKNIALFAYYDPEVEIEEIKEILKKKFDIAIPAEEYYNLEEYVDYGFTCHDIDIDNRILLAEKLLEKFDEEDKHDIIIENEDGEELLRFKVEEFDQEKVFALEIRHDTTSPSDFDSRDATEYLYQFNLKENKHNPKYMNLHK